MPVDILSTEQLVGGGSDVVHFEYQLGHYLVLYAQVITVDVRIPDSFRQNNPSQNGHVRIERSPACQVTCGLRSDTLARISGRPTERWRCPGRRTRRAGASLGSVNYGIHIAIQEVVSEIKRVVGEIPSGIGQRVI